MFFFFFGALISLFTKRQHRPYVLFHIRNRLIRLLFESLCEGLKMQNLNLNGYKYIFIAHNIWREVLQMLNKDETF